MVQNGRNPVTVVIANGIYVFEQFLLDQSFFANPTDPAGSRRRVRR
jgi:hypothetical protein